MQRKSRERKIDKQREILDVTTIFNAIKTQINCFDTIYGLAINNEKQIAN